MSIADLLICGINVRNACILGSNISSHVDLNNCKQKNWRLLVPLMYTLPRLIVLIQGPCASLGWAAELHRQPSAQRVTLFFTMSELQDESPALSVRFKKRKTVHPKRVFSEEETPEPSSSHGAFTPSAQDAPSLPKEATNDEEETGLNLKEILRNRKRPRERLKEVARKTETSNTELAVFEGPRPDQYTSRFVGQTGQVVDRDDEQM